jgi:hypothetical protein
MCIVRLLTPDEQNYYKMQASMNMLGSCLGWSDMCATSVLTTDFSLSECGRVLPGLVILNNNRIVLIVLRNIFFNVSCMISLSM